MGKLNYKPRKATFTVSLVAGRRVFTPVNRRAHIVAGKLGKRTKVTLDDMRKTKGLGSYKMYFYTTDGALKPIRF